MTVKDLKALCKQRCHQVNLLVDSEFRVSVFGISACPNDSATAKVLESFG